MQADDNIDERKRKRMLSNRESARRSRMKKQQHLDTLVNEAARFSEENSGILKQMNLTSAKFSRIDSENSALRIRLMELAERLKFLNCTLKHLEEETGLAMDIPELPDATILKPWPLSCSVYPFLMPTYMFQC